MTGRYDLIVVGAGIVGLGHALAAVRRGLSVTVVDRDPEAAGASVRNFGFVTVTGQQAGDTWRRARRSQQVWLEVAPEAGIRVEHEGLIVVAQRPGDVAEVVANPEKANVELGWRTTRSLADACRDSWAWQSANPNGYAA